MTEVHHKLPAFNPETPRSQVQFSHTSCEFTPETLESVFAVPLKKKKRGGWLYISEVSILDT